MTTPHRCADPEDTSAAYARALAILAGAQQSSARLAAKLRLRGFTAPVIEATLATLSEAGLLDDSLFAASAAARRLHKGYGNAVIQAELRNKGVDAEIRTQTVLEISAAEQVNAATRVAQRSRPRPGETPLHHRQRLYAALSRRGFSGQVIAAAMQERDAGAA